MCEENLLTQIISWIYLAICFLIPLIYLFLYHKAKGRKNYKKAFLIAFIMFVLLFSIKLIVRVDVKGFECPNCFLNNICPQEDDIENNDNDDANNEGDIIDNTENTTTSSTTTTTTTTTTTKRTTNPAEKTYEKIAEPTGEKIEVGKTSKGYTIYQIDGVTYIDGYLIANKTYGLPEDFVPKNTYASSENRTNTCNTCINNTAYDAWQDMKADATAVGLNIYISSGYRPYQTQKTIYERYVRQDGKEEADTYSARPGHSEHQSGECFDLNSITDAFANTDEGKWVNQNAYKYGFIIRYPQGKTDETGYKYESWHLRYVGTELAYKLYNNGDWITMEDYFGITSEYQN